MSDDAAAARERRQARIRAGASNRLAKITGSKSDFKDSALTKPPADSTSSTTEPSSTASSTASTAASTAPSTSKTSHEDDPEDVLPEDIPLQKGAGAGTVAGGIPAVTSFNPPKNAQDIPEEFAQDPLFQMLQRMQSGAGAGANPDFGSMFQGDNGPMSLLHQLNAQADAGYSDQDKAAAAAAAVRPEDIARNKRNLQLWIVVHSTLMALLGVYVAFNPYRVMVLFTTLEVVLHSIEWFVGPPASPSILTPFLSFLPPSIQSYARSGVRNLRLGRSVYRDFCIVLFVYGILHATEGTNASSIYYRT